MTSTELPTVKFVLFSKSFAFKHKKWCGGRDLILDR